MTPSQPLSQSSFRRVGRPGNVFLCSHSVRKLTKIRVNAPVCVSTAGCSVNWSRGGSLGYFLTKNCYSLLNLNFVFVCKTPVLFRCIRWSPSESRTNPGRALAEVLNRWPLVSEAPFHPLWGQSGPGTDLPQDISAFP